MSFLVGFVILFLALVCIGCVFGRGKDGAGCCECVGKVFVVSGNNEFVVSGNDVFAVSVWLVLSGMVVGDGEFLVVWESLFSPVVA